MKKEEEEPKNEASSPAQQAAIAIAMKKAGKKPKNESIAAKYLKQIKKDKLQEAEGEKEKKNDKEVSVKQKTFKKGETLSGKREQIQINPQINEK
jgi:Ni/Co efflux regulator RcnB